MSKGTELATIQEGQSQTLLLETDRRHDGDKHLPPSPPGVGEEWEEHQDITTFNSFDDMGLPEELLRGIYSYGFEKPSVIQQKAIKPIMLGKDMIAQSQSGTGKTGTFSIGTLASVDPNIKECQSIILAPTRDLADQTYKVISILSDFMKIQVHLCIGGRTGTRESIRAIQSGGIQIVVGTPGRVHDMIQRGALRLNSLRQFIVDEADEMLSLGFRDQIYQVFKFLPKETQVCLFSATMPLDVLKISNLFMRDPIRVLVQKERLTLDGIEQFYIAVEREEWKLETLSDLYQSLTVVQAIIFCNTKRKVEWLADQMEAQDFTVSCMHSDMDQQERDRTLQEFRSGSSRILLSTDLLARGIDVQQVSLVINYDLPTNRESYIHRIGRSGRYGRKGVAINFVRNEDVRLLRDIEHFYSTYISEMPMDFASSM